MSYQKKDGRGDKDLKVCPLVTRVNNDNAVLPVQIFSSFIFFFAFSSGSEKENHFPLCLSLAHPYCLNVHVTIHGRLTKIVIAALYK